MSHVRLAAALVVGSVLSVASVTPEARAQGVIHTLPGAAPTEYRPTAAAGDVDGDGFGDFFVSTITGIEQVEVRSGRTTAVLHQFTGSQSFGAGPALRGAVDLDGDGRSDLLIGDPEIALFSPHPSAGGTARAVSGASGATLWAVSAPPGDYLGISLDAGPDVDQDGFPDVVIGARQGAFTASTPGYVRGVSGTTGATLFTRLGAQAAAHFGVEVALLADADGDGIPDLAVASRHPAPFFNWAGQVEVISGATQQTLWTATGAAVDDVLGLGLQTLGDLDGDGLTDVVYSIPGDDTSAPDGGSLRARRGVNGAPIWSFFGAASDLLSSTRLSGDADGDGVPDLLVRRVNSLLDVELRIHSGATGGFHASFGVESVSGHGGVGDVNGDAIADVGVGVIRTDAAYETDVEIRSTVCGATPLLAIGCPGQPGAPTLTLGGCATAGGTVTLTVAGGPPGAAALLVVGVGAATTALPSGCVLAIATPALFVPTALDANGALAIAAELPIPTQSGVAHVQVLIADGGVAGGITATEAWSVYVP